MAITLSTVLSMILFSSMAILLLRFVIARNEMMIKIGIPVAILFLSAILPINAGLASGN